MSRLGWGFPQMSKKAHVFHGGRSLCGKWGYFGEVTPITEVLPRGPEDCAACHKKLVAHLKPSATRSNTVATEERNDDVSG